MKPKIRIIGDIHSQIEKSSRKISYLELIENIPYTIQVGDMGNDCSALKDLSLNHRFVSGNHDNYGSLIPNYLGDFGTHSIPLKEDKHFDFFYIRGAYSIDRKRRVLNESWWEKEELNEEQCLDAFAAYKKAKPKIMITHDCPFEMVKLVARNSLRMLPTTTNSLLQRCFNEHRPLLWIWGHYHRSWIHRHELGTKFICLDKMHCIDFDESGNLMTSFPN